jgi:DNA-binding transcriptional LysR family regulator
MQSWDLIQAFLALHRTGSYETGSQLLQMDHTTLRRKIQLLERDAAGALFVRHNGALVLAPGNQALLNAALRMEAAHSDFLQQSDLARHSGTIRLSTLDIIANLLAPDIAAFRRLHPGIQIEITTESHFVDIERDRVDLAFRAARPMRGRDGLRKVALLNFGIFGAHDYFARRPDAAEPHDLLSLYAHPGGHDHEFLLADERWHEQANLAGHVVARADGYTTLLRMCEQGMGLAMLPSFLARPSPHLVRDASQPGGVDVDVYAVIRHDIADQPKIRAFLTHICAALAKHEAELAG